MPGSAGRSAARRRPGDGAALVRRRQCGYEGTVERGDPPPARALGLTQARLAELSGLDQPTISRLESGARIPPLPVLERVAEALGVRLTIGIEKP
ncbi:hypothetical protein BJF79_29240 [Actinomadura sp. CNU-125]|uniref:helix-turn-helix domain-containing protein n=1 Tax=Actinomadura sp. CNU-125 TaxID=1904961 RepID=UPI00095924A8|nr:helix-turn-helix transcriptional regulator [Actinomadura sp. CNU-125]OLT37680.1 hypothetical protein BJF79_29240 [Actinomadura sp. CNU-125]